MQNKAVPDVIFYRRAKQTSAEVKADVIGWCNVRDISLDLMVETLSAWGKIPAVVYDDSCREVWQ